MNANKALISEIFNMTTLIEVPFFQRSDVWKEDLWERFLDDLEFSVKTNTPHFLGTLILQSAGKTPPGSPYTSKLLLVDGQQRLTTFLIFLKVLCLKINQPTVFDAQYRLIVSKKLALQHGKNDREAFEAAMNATVLGPITGPKSSSLVIQAYNYFMQHIDPAKLDYMTVISNAQFVRIDLGPNDDAQQIFDSLNSLGINLTTSELLKNYFFSQNNLTAYQSIWEVAFELNDAVKAYWDTEIETGSLRRPLIDIFFDAYFQLLIQDKKYGVTLQDKQVYARIHRLSASYQQFIDNYCGGDKNVVLAHLKEDALLFMHLFQPNFCNSMVPSTFSIERLNVVIFGLKTTTLIPYVLYLAKKVSDPAVLNEMYGILESYIMRRTITQATSKNYNNLFPSLIAADICTPQDLRSRLQAASGMNSYVPTDTELQNGFTNSKLVNLYSKGVLYLLESSLHPQASATALLGFNGYSLEHLMPKKWRNNWPSCATEQEAELRDTKLLTLGNLAIITQSLNTSIRDSSWDVKKSGKSASKPGLDQCASGLITLQDALKCSSWSETEIDIRAAWLYSIAKSLWRI